METYIKIDAVLNITCAVKMNKGLVIGVIVVLLLVSSVSAVTITKTGLRMYLRDELKKYFENNNTQSGDPHVAALAVLKDLYHNSNESNINLDNKGVSTEEINKIKSNEKYSRYIRGDIGDYVGGNWSGDEEDLNDTELIKLKDLKEKCKSDSECASGKCMSPAASLIGYIYIWHKECVREECKKVRKGIFFRTLDCSGSS